MVRITKDSLFQENTDNKRKRGRRGTILYFFPFLFFPTRADARNESTESKYSEKRVSVAFVDCLMLFAIAQFSQPEQQQQQQQKHETSQSRVQLCSFLDTLFVHFCI